MDKDESSIPSFEALDTADTVPSSSSADIEDARIICTNHQSLCSIVKITDDHVSKLADSLNLNDNRSEFIAKFNESFTNALQENILINGLPWMMDQSHLTSPQKEDQKQMADDALLAKLSKAVSDVAHKRKFCPEQCCRILNMQMKHELQNLKKAKTVDDSTLPKDSSGTTLKRSKTKPFIDFCKEYKSIQENVQQIVTKERKLQMQIALADDLQKHH